MKELLFFISLAHFYLVTSSLVTPPHDTFGLMKEFRRYLIDPTKKSYNRFKRYALSYYKESPAECLKSLGRYTNDWIFKYIFWRALKGDRSYTDHSWIAPRHYSEVLEWISDEIRWIFKSCCCSDQAKFKTEMQTISLLIKLAKKTSNELKSIGINDEIVKGLDNLIAIWNYLIRNISIDFVNETIDFYSLIRTLNEIIFISQAGPSLNDPTKRLSRLYALIWVYLCHIDNGCTAIFDMYRHKTLMIFLIQNFDWSYDYTRNVFHPDHLQIQFERLNEAGLPTLNDIARLLEEFGPPQIECIRLKIAKKVVSFAEVALLLDEELVRLHPGNTWRVKALALLEAYIARSSLTLKVIP